MSDKKYYVKFDITKRQQPGSDPNPAGIGGRGALLRLDSAGCRRPSRCGGSGREAFVQLAVADQRLLTPAQVRRLARVDARSLAAGMVGTLAEGVYRGG